MRKQMMAIVALLMALTSFPALALDLHQARDTGLIGERVDGYVASLKATPDVQALVADVNAKRKVEYARISKENGQPVDVVAKLAAQQIIGNLKLGNSYQAADGQWKKR